MLAVVRLPEAASKEHLDLCCGQVTNNSHTLAVARLLEHKSLRVVSCASLNFWQCFSAVFSGGFCAVLLLLLLGVFLFCENMEK